MKAKPIQVNALKSQIQQDFVGACLFGPDVGVAAEVSEKIAKMITPDLKDDFCVIRILSTQLKENPSLLLDEGNAPSLMGGRKLIWLQDADNTVFEAVQSYVQGIKTNSFLLITAGNLTKNSALRVFCEDNDRILAIVCYLEESKDVAGYIQEVLAEFHKKIDPPALPVLVERLSENRLATKRELEKLVCYIGDKKMIELSDVYDIVTDTQNASIDRFCFAVAGGEYNVALKEYHCMLENGENTVGIIRILYNFFNKMFEASDDVMSGQMDEALKKVLKPAQFRLKTAMQNLLKVWKKHHIFKVLNLLIEAERKNKETGIPADLMLERVIMQIASAGKRLKM